MIRGISSRTALLLLALATAAPDLHAQTTRERGTGPFRLVTPRGEVTVRLLRRDRELIWVDQQLSNGSFVETGLNRNDIVRFEIPRPAVFDAVDRATAAEQIAKVQVALKAISDSLRPYRDLPGMPVDEALLLQGILLERTQRWPAALAAYQELAAAPHRPPLAERAQLRAALCHAKLGQYDRVSALLEERTIPDDDRALLSELYFARAQARAALGRHDAAIMDYLFLVVFDPFLLNNESRCLAAALPSYAALQDWSAMWKTLAVLRAQYPDSEETKKAEEIAKTYEKQLAAETEYQDPAATDEETTP